MLGRNDFMTTSWRIANNSKIDEVVADWTRHLNVADIVDQLAARDIPCSPIRDIHAVASWPHLRERQMLEQLRHPKLPQTAGPLAPTFPLKFSAAPAGYEAPAPLARQHNDEIYRGLLGISERELCALTADGVI